MRSNILIKIAITLIFHLVCVSSDEVGSLIRQDNSNLTLPSFSELASFLHNWTEYEFSFWTKISDRQKYIEKLKVYVCESPLEAFEKNSTRARKDLERQFRNIRKDSMQSDAFPKSQFHLIYRALMQYEGLQRKLNENIAQDQVLLCKVTELKVLALSVLSSSSVIQSMWNELRRRTAHIRWSWGNLQVEFAELGFVPSKLLLRFDKRSLEVDQVLNLLESLFAIPY